MELQCGMFEKLLKLLVSIVLLVGLWIAREAASNGRYVYSPGIADPAHPAYLPIPTLLDSRTGAIYFVWPGDSPSGEKNVPSTELQPQTGQWILHRGSSEH
jgi:hypothetical protein